MSVDAPARTRPTVVAAPEPERPPRPRPPRRRWRGRLGIQSKLLAMLLAVSVLSVLVTGFFGYRFGTRRSSMPSTSSSPRYVMRGSER